MENPWKFEERQHFYYDDGNIKHFVSSAHSYSTTKVSFVVDIVAVMCGDCEWNLRRKVVFNSHSYPFNRLAPYSFADTVYGAKTVEWR